MASINLIEAFQEFKDAENIDRPTMMKVVEDVFKTLLRKKYGSDGASDEEILLRFFTSKEEVDKMHAAGPARSYSPNGNPLLNLVAEISKPTERNSVYIQRPNFSLRLEKRRAL